MKIRRTTSSVVHRSTFIVLTTGRRSQGSFDLSGRTTRTSYSAPPPLPGNHPTFPKGFQLPPAPPGGVTSFASAINSNPIGARRTSNPLHNAGLAPQNDEYLDPRTSQLGLERRGSTSSGAYGFDAGTTSVGGYDSASLFAAGETEYDNFDGQRYTSVCLLATLQTSTFYLGLLSFSNDPNPSTCHLFYTRTHARTH